MISSVTVLKSKNMLLRLNLLKQVFHNLKKMWKHIQVNLKILMLNTESFLVK